MSDVGILEPTDLKDRFTAWTSIKLKIISNMLPRGFLVGSICHAVVIHNAYTLTFEKELIRFKRTTTGMSQNNEQLRSAYMNKLDTINNQTSSLSGQLNEIDKKVVDIDETLNGLPTRIQQIRKMNYRVMVNFEKDLATLSERWSSIRQNVKDTVNANMPPLASEIRVLETEIGQRRIDTVYEVSQLTNLDLRISTLNVRVSDLYGRVSATIGDVENRLHQLDQDVGVAERTVNLTSNASFPWKVNETPILSINVKDLNNDVEGILSLTNQRFIFESEKEVVLKKRLFIATEKKKVRETIVDKPIGIVDSVTKGRVGLLAGQGIYVAFKPESGQQEMKLDTKGNDADLVTRFHKFISTGQADEELSKTEEAKPDTQKPVPVICPRCGAPYPDEIYRGQTSVQCKYCNTTIPISR